MDSILKKSYDKILYDEVFVKLTVFSLLPYSLLFVGYLFYQTYFVVTSVRYGVHWGELKLYVENIFSFGENNLSLFLIIALLILAAYFFIPPIVEASLIEYLDKGKGISYSLGRGFMKFFPMFELHGFLSLFSFLFFFIVVSRLYILNMLDSLFILPILLIWFFFVIFFNLTGIYAKFLVVLENMNPFEAIKKSILLTFLNFGKTIRYFFIYVLLYFRLILNILVLVGLPLLVLYLFLKSNVSDASIVKYTIYFVMFLLFVLTAYVNGLIEAYFSLMWFNIFKEIEKE